MLSRWKIAESIGYNIIMERKRKKKVSRRRKKAPKESKEVTFKAFFSWCVNTGKLLEHQENEILAFFRDHRLKDKEDRDKYLKVLENY